MQKLMEGIQDNYTLAQPGIQTKIMALKDLMKRLDSKRVDLEAVASGLSRIYSKYVRSWMYKVQLLFYN